MHALGEARANESLRASPWPLLLGRPRRLPGGGRATYVRCMQSLRDGDKGSDVVDTVQTDGAAAELAAVRATWHTQDAWGEEGTEGVAGPDGESIHTSSVMVKAGVSRSAVGHGAAA
jgi:hypothetical protein